MKKTLSLISISAASSALQSGTAGKTKATDNALVGLEKSHKKAAQLTAKANDALKAFGSKAQRLHKIADYLLDQEY